ncbi:MAG: dolichol kinase [Synechococcus sp.]|uniref:diacylglycerol/polyprenol kinase family protein n=1 Tax=Synechococcus sp. YX-04-1 TaxID=3062778 RepID=UPI00121D2411|nr:dolichol kinase [Synechococcus sp. YX-04-1]MBA4736345.1 dolichol kinase [Synechococcus sp.]MDO6351289.1 dolichol kinase [Synechococcus sp. YX-04-1]RZN97842.1 MAG: dolichol kinase [Synechococcus sp. MED-G134]
MLSFTGPIAILIWMAMVTAGAVLCRRLRPNQRELSRKIVHIGTGAVVPLAWFFQIPFVVALPVAAVITVLTAMNHQWRFIPAVEDVDRNSYGTIAYGIAITTLLLLFWPTRADAVSAGVLVMALGDGLAGLIGRNVKSPKWVLFGQTKSSVGTMTMAVVSSLVLIGLARWSGADLSLPATLGMVAIATGLEQLSWGGLDNLSVPLSVGMLWSQLVG